MPTPTIINCIKVKICTLQGYYTAYNGNFLPTFRDLLVPSSRVKISKKKKVVLKRRQGIATIHCLITQKSAYLTYFVAEY